MSQALGWTEPIRPYEAWLGRSLIHPAVDVLIIAGGGSIVLTLALLAAGVDFDRLNDALTDARIWPLLLLLVNSSHFAASWLRFYRKPDGRSVPGLSLALPVSVLILTGIAAATPGAFGETFLAIYLTWSPFHYAAQAYGIAILYGKRSGCALPPRERRCLRFMALVPFAHVVLTAQEAGLHWLLAGFGWAGPGLAAIEAVASAALPWLFVLTPFLVLRKVGDDDSGGLPLLSLIVLAVNGIWFFVLSPLLATALVALFHGLQYLALVMAFEARSAADSGASSRGIVSRLGAFYLGCVCLAFLLFHGLPAAFRSVGIDGPAVSGIVVAGINIHHFVLDAFIWKLRKSDSNSALIATHGRLGSRSAILRA